MEMPSIYQNKKGLYQKYVIRKVTGVKIGGSLTTKPVDRNAEYFVLRLDENQKDINHMRACRKAIHAYADWIEPYIPELAKDLRERYPMI